MNPGIYDYIPLSKYHGGAGVSNSILSLIALSPAHAKEYLENPQPGTEPQNLGEAFHTLTLEEHEFHGRFMIFDGDKRTKEAKEKWQAAEDKGLVIIRAAQLDNIIGMVKAVKAHPDASALLEKLGAEFEKSVYWKDQSSGILCKARPDILIHNEKLSAVVDLKSCRRGVNKDKYTWVRQILSYRYHVQAAMYLEGCSKAYKHEFKNFLWITCESEPPYGVNVFMAKQDIIDEGYRLFRRDLNTYAECVHQNLWPGYIEGIKEVGLPENKP